MSDEQEMVYVVCYLGKTKQNKTKKRPRLFQFILKKNISVHVQKLFQQNFSQRICNLRTYCTWIHATVTEAWRNDLGDLKHQTESQIQKLLDYRDNVWYREAYILSITDVEAFNEGVRFKF